MTRWRTVEREAGGRPWLSLRREGRRVRLRFAGVGEFRISGEDIEGRPDPGGDPASFRRILVDQVLPRALHLAGTPVLHASAVAGTRGALVFLGASGTGKSTAAARRVLRGWSLLADDGVRLEVRRGVVLAHPTHPLLRVREDVFRELPRRVREGAVPGAGKWTLDARRGPLRFARRPVPVRQVVLLGRGRGPVPPREALVALLDGTFRADPWDIHAYARDVAILSPMALLVPFSRGGTGLAL